MEDRYLGSIIELIRGEAVCKCSGAVGDSCDSERGGGGDRWPSVDIGWRGKNQ
jgi:hypothetical protein